MSNELRSRADANLVAAAASLRMADPRPPYRDRLRALKDTDPDAFSRALRHYEETVLPALAEGTDAMAVWAQYGQTLAAFSAPGRMMSIDAAGRAGKLALPLKESSLLLHLPDDNSAAVFVAAMPLIASPAQSATLDLLAHGRLALSADPGDS